MIVDHYRKPRETYIIQQNNPLLINTKLHKTHLMASTHAYVL